MTVPAYAIDDVPVKSGVDVLIPQHQRLAERIHRENCAVIAWCFPPRRRVLRADETGIGQAAGMGQTRSQTICVYASSFVLRISFSSISPKISTSAWPKDSVP